jgi:hypothetical protein
MRLPTGSGATRAGLDRAAVAGSTAATGAIALAALPFVEGWAQRGHLALYLAPLFAAVGWWAHTRLRDLAASSPARVAVDAAVVAAAAMRFAGDFPPISGHMLFLTHAAATGRGGVRLLAPGILLETTWFKLTIWDGPRSCAPGPAVGLAAAALYRRLPAGTRALVP